MENEFYYILTYQKIDEMTFVGHLDLMNFWQKVLRMAELPIAYTQGFNKKMKLNLIQPLPLGMEGLNEYLHLTLTKEIQINEAQSVVYEKLNNKLVLKKFVKTKYPSKWFTRHLSTAVYKIYLEDGSDLSGFLSTHSDKILKFDNYEKNSCLIKIINTPQIQLNMFKLFSLLPNIAIIQIKRVRLEYQA